MKYQTYLRELRSLYENFLTFIDNDECNEGFAKLSKQINDMKIKDDKEELEHFLRIVVSVSNNHHRNSHFFPKIEQILQLFEIKLNQLIFKIVTFS